MANNQHPSLLPLATGGVATASSHRPTPTRHRTTSALREPCRHDAPSASPAASLLAPMADGMAIATLHHPSPAAAAPPRSEPKPEPWRLRSDEQRQQPPMAAEGGWCAARGFLPHMR